MAVSQLYAHFLICMCVSAYVNILVAEWPGALGGAMEKGQDEKKKQLKRRQFDTIT